MKAFIEDSLHIKITNDVNTLLRNGVFHDFINLTYTGSRVPVHKNPTSAYFAQENVKFASYS